MRDFFRERRALVESALEQRMPPEGVRPARLVAAMRYSLFSGGKRIRPILVLAAAESVCGRHEDALFAGCAVEMLHTYSLIHDDLPAMDNDDFRRGRQTCHRVFDEPTAILAGDALLTLAFDVLSDPEEGSEIRHPVRLRMIKELAGSAGWRGMAGGQQVDMESEGSTPDLPTLSYIHAHKTGALIRCSVILGALAAGADDEILQSLARYGEKVGLAFQIVDDILDVTATTEEMGKDQGSDASRGKVTYPALFGLEDARNRARHLIEEAKAFLGPLQEKDLLQRIADYILSRRL